MKTNYPKDQQDLRFKGRTVGGKRKRIQVTRKVSSLVDWTVIFVQGQGEKKQQRSMLSYGRQKKGSVCEDNNYVRDRKRSKSPRGN